MFLGSPRLAPPAGSAAAIQRTATGTAVPLPSSIRLDNRGGQPLPPAVLQKMEQVFQTRFNDVRIHVGHHVAAVGALALTQGTHIHFAPGHYNPATPRGERVLAHELAHVVQQRAGRVTHPFGEGKAVVQDRSLDAEAERMARVVSMRGPGDSIQKLSIFGWRITGGTVTVAPFYSAVGGGPVAGPIATAGNMKQCGFELHAGFDNTSRLTWASCCEIRHMISWSAGQKPTHAGFNAVGAAANTWHEDRDHTGRFLGRRANQAMHVDYYFDNANPGVANQANGDRYYGFDGPGRVQAMNMGQWFFRLDVVDTCNGNLRLASSPVLTVDWQNNVMF